MPRNFQIIEYEIYTDGAAKTSITNPYRGFGGWAYVVTNDGSLICGGHGGELETTNQRMELTAVANALEYIDNVKRFNERVIIYSDSAYLVNCYLQGWYKKWLKNHWTNAKGESIANQDLWMRIIPFFDRQTYCFAHVKGHSGVYFNEMVDKMASDTAKDLKINYKGRNNVE